MADPGTIVGTISLGIQVTQSLFDYYKAYKSQYSYIKGTTQKLDNLLDTFETLRVQIQGRRFRTDEQDLLQKIESLVDECKECMQELQEEADKFKKYPVNSTQSLVQTTVRRIAYPFQKSTLEKLDKDIDDIVARLKLVLQLLQQEVIDKSHNDIEDVKALLDLVRFSQISAELREWLDSPDTTIDFNEACKKKHPGTGLWLVNGERFIAWLRCPESFLWFKGFAGCGKSVLCSTAIQYTFRFRRSDPKIGIAFFFFKFDDTSKQDASALLRTLILQLSTQLASKHAVQRLRETYRHATPPDQVLLDCLQQLVRQFKEVYLLIDALDESPRDKHRDTMLNLLTDIRSWKEPGLHLLVTSRDEIDIRNELDPTPEEVIEMRNRNVDQDIAAFVAQNLRNNRKLTKWKKHYDIIQDTLGKRANGVFRWVECQFRSLERCPANQQLLNKLLQSLPVSLDDTYARMLRNIPSELVDYAQQLFRVLCCAIRPLTSLELLDVLAVGPDSPCKYDSSRKFDDISALEEICPGFMEDQIDYESRRATIRIAHFSVQEFLEAERILLHQDIACFHVRRSSGHSLMASICLAFLTDPQIVEDNQSVEDTQSVGKIKAFPFSEYAARYWSRHHSLCDSKSKIELQALPLFQEMSYFNTWTHAWDIDFDGDTERPWRYWYKYGVNSRRKTASPLYYAALLGLVSTTSKVLGRMAHGINSALRAPAIVRIVNAVGGDYGTALQAAVSRGHKEVVELLIENGADIDIQGNDDGGPLHTALRRGYEEIAELLVTKGANVNLSKGRGTPLQIASAKNSKRLVQLLIEKGADINDKRPHGTALMRASGNICMKIARLFFEEGADVDAEEGINDTALFAASARGHKEVVELLLKNGANIDAFGEAGTALQIATAKGHKEIVELLLEKGANINIVTKVMNQGRLEGYGTALFIATCKGDKELVEVFLNKGADVNIIGKSGTPLHRASFDGDKELVELLLDGGADIDTIGRNGTALYIAAAQGYNGVIEMLLDRGADVNFKVPAFDGAGFGFEFTALQRALGHPHVEVVELLLKKGADIDAVGSSGTALHIAAGRGQKGVVEVLLDRGADVNIKAPVFAHDGFGIKCGTALQIAAYNGYLELVKLLLEKGADIDAVGSSGTALHIVSKAGDCEEVMQLLIEKGANPNIIEGSGKLIRLGYQAYSDAEPEVISDSSDSND